jgi:hypothetical protein
MSFTLDAPAPPPRQAKPARKASHLSEVILALLRRHGQMPCPDLVALALACLMDRGKPAHKANIYTRLRQMKAAGLVEVRRMDGARWIIPADQGGKQGRRHVIQGHAVVRGGKATFKAKTAKGCPAFSGAATLSFIK